MHDFAYADLLFDGREPRSFLATPGAKEVGVEMFSMSKSYGMAGWRLGFVLGNAEIVERINLLNDHCRVGIFRPIQEAGIAALTGPQDSVAERAATYERRRDRVLEVVDAVSEGTFYVWFKLPEGLTSDQLLVEHRLAIAPGEGFGPSGAAGVESRLPSRMTRSKPGSRFEAAQGRGLAGQGRSACAPRRCLAGGVRHPGADEADGCSGAKAEA